MRAMQTLQLNSGKLRYEVREGRRFWVAPLTMIVPGVLNGSQGALYYPPDEISKTHRAWHGVPVTVNHPDKNGMPCSIMEEGIWDKFGIGLVQFPTVNDDGKLLAEAWIDEALCRSRRPDILQNLRAGRTIELSTGLFTDNHPSKGDHNGKPYTHIARNYRPDHLAILPDTPGACSVKDGCGVLVNELVVPISPMFNAFCPTGKGGGQDNSCGKGGGGEYDKLLSDYKAAKQKRKDYEAGAAVKDWNDPKWMKGRQSLHSTEIDLLNSLNALEAPEPEKVGRGQGSTGRLSKMAEKAGKKLYGSSLEYDGDPEVVELKASSLKGSDKYFDDYEYAFHPSTGKGLETAGLRITKEHADKDGKVYSYSATDNTIRVVSFGKKPTHNALVVPVTPLFNCDWVTTKTGTRLCIGDGGKVEKGPKAVKDALNKGKGKSDEETEDYKPKGDDEDTKEANTTTFDPSNEVEGEFKPDAEAKSGAAKYEDVEQNLSKMESLEAKEKGTGDKLQSIQDEFNKTKAMLKSAKEQRDGSELPHAPMREPAKHFSGLKSAISRVAAPAQDGKSVAERLGGMVGRLGRAIKTTLGSFKGGSTAEKAGRVARYGAAKVGQKVGRIARAFGLNEMPNIRITPVLNAFDSDEQRRAFFGKFGSDSAKSEKGSGGKKPAGGKGKTKKEPSRKDQIAKLEDDLGRLGTAIDEAGGAGWGGKQGREHAAMQKQLDELKGTVKRTSGISHDYDQSIHKSDSPMQAAKAKLDEVQAGGAKAQWWQQSNGDHHVDVGDTSKPGGVIRRYTFRK